MKQLLRGLVMLGLMATGLAVAADGQLAIHGDLDRSGVIDAVDEVILRHFLVGNIYLIPLPASAGEIYASDPIAGFLRYVPPGTFQQGSPDSEPCHMVMERAFSHTLTRGLAVMETEVTRQMWADLMETQDIPVDPSDTEYSPGMNFPVQNVTFYEAVLFANKLSLERGLTPCYYYSPGHPVEEDYYNTSPFYCDWTANGYRLPSEGEWEYFCRAGTTTPFWMEETGYLPGNCGDPSAPGMYPVLEWGDWFWPNHGAEAHPVGSKAANPWRLKDVHGNVSEWCWDWREIDYPAGPATDYHGPSGGTYRIFRGGSFFRQANDCRSARRLAGTPGTREKDTGFRLVRMVH